MRLHTLLRVSDLFARFDRPARGVFRAVIEPRKPRRRALRVLLAVVGLVLLAALVVAAVAVGTVVLLGALGWRLLRPRAVAPGREQVIDADYRVVPRPLLSR